MPNSRVFSQWVPPPIGCFKINVDDAVSESIYGLSCVIRDQRGEVLGAASKSVHVVGSTDMLEALAVEFGVMQALQFGCYRVFVETDCSKVASHLNDLSLDYSPFHIVIKNILWFCNRFHSISFS